MGSRLKQTILWTLYVSLLLIGLFTIISLVINVLAPTFFPDTDISGFKDYINTFCVILSFLSVGLGVYSVWQANESGKQSNEMITSLQALKQQQESMYVTLKSLKDNRIVVTQREDSRWELDNVIR